MGLLDRLERTLEALIEGRFPGRFGGQVHPLEIARRLSREMLAHARVGLRRKYVPNQFRVRVSTEDVQALRPLERSVLTEIREFLEEEARERDLYWPGPLEVTLEEDDDLPPGAFDVDASFLEGPTTLEAAGSAPLSLEALPSGAPSPDPVSPRFPSPGPEATSLPSRPTVSAHPARLLGLSGFAQGLVLDLTASEMSMGRLPDSDLQVPDAEVSRRQAVVRRTAGGWSIQDAGSRHGTRVNGHLLTSSRLLASGDVIEIGASALRFEPAVEDTDDTRHDDRVSG